MNRHAQFRPHTDSGNGSGQSLSMIVGLGDYVRSRTLGVQLTVSTLASLHPISHVCRPTVNWTPPWRKRDPATHDHATHNREWTVLPHSLLFTSALSMPPFSCRAVGSLWWRAPCMTSGIQCLLPEPTFQSCICGRERALSTTKAMASPHSMLPAGPTHCSLLLCLLE